LEVRKFAGYLVKVLNAAAAVEDVKTLDRQIHTLEPLTLGHSVISKWPVR
jgi:hypothetical protein